MRILIAHSFYRLAGGEDRYVQQQTELLGRRHDVRLLARRNERLRPDLSAAAGMIYSAGARAEVLSEIDSWRPDLVHLHNPYPSLGPAVHLAAAKRHLPLVVTLHNYRLRCPNGYMFTEGADCHRCERGNYLNAVLHPCFPKRTQAGAYAAALWIHRFLVRLEDKVDLFISPSEFVRDTALRWGFPSSKVTVVRNFAEVSPAEPRSPGRYGLYLGRLSSEKGLDTLLEALRRAGDPEFLIVGDGPLEEGLKDLAGQLRLENVTFTGRVAATDVPEILTQARYMVVPSLWDENAPLAALEGLAAGRPLIVSDAGGLPELVANGEGVTFPPGRVDAMAERILSLDDPGLCLQMGERALASARRDFSAEVHLAALEEAYERVLSKRR